MAMGTGLEYRRSRSHIARDYQERYAGSKAGTQEPGCFHGHCPFIELGFADVFQSLTHQLDDMIVIEGIESFFTCFTEFDQARRPQHPQLM